MDNETVVVRASRANFGKTLLGGFQVTYRCPRCKQELITKNDAIAAGDTCPHCQASFAFDDKIKEAFAALVAEKQSREAEKERIREAKKIEQARLAAEKAQIVAAAAEQAARDREANRLLEEQREQKARREHRRAHYDNATNLSDAHGCVGAMLVLGGLAVALMLLASFAVLSTGGYSNEGTTLLITAASVGVSLSIVYVFFRILGAIHAVLVMILDRLNSSSDRD